MADNLRLLADKAFPNLEDQAKEQLSLDRYLSLLDKPELSLAVRQKRPKTIDDAVAFTLEVESYLTVQPPRQQQVSTVSEVSQTETVSSPAAVAAIHTRQHKAIMEMLRILNT